MFLLSLGGLCIHPGPAFNHKFLVPKTGTEWLSVVNNLWWMYNASVSAWLGCLQVPK